jgi:cytoskeletal protein RodZ
MASQKLGAPAPVRSILARTLDLSKLRRTKGISLEEIAERTKISLRFLHAIEAEEFEKLPGGIFNTSYLRQYAEAIGFDESMLLAHYDCKVHPVEERHDPVSEDKRGSRGFFDRWLRISAQAQ